MIKINKRDLLIAQKGLCFYCGLPMGDDGQTATSCTVDHFYPRVSGGKTYNNIVLAHSKCNGEKSGRLPTNMDIMRFDILYSKIRETKAIVGDLQKMWGRVKKHKKRVKFDKRKGGQVGTW